MISIHDFLPTLASIIGANTENGGAKLVHGGGGIGPLRAA
jgi:hypothetical protein